MMDFDKLIKDKAEQAEYAYKPTAWRRFRQSKGEGGAWKFWLAGTTTAIVVGGAALIGTHLFTNRHLDSISPSEPVAVVSDSSCSNATSPTKEETATPIQKPSANNHRAKAGDIRPTDPEKDLGTMKETASEKPMSGTEKSNVKAPKPYRRPLVIDVDTIKENVPSDEELRNGNSRLF